MSHSLAKAVGDVRPRWGRGACLLVDEGLASDGFVVTAYTMSTPREASRRGRRSRPRASHLHAGASVATEGQVKPAAERTVPLLEPEPVVASIDAAGYDARTKQWTIVLRVNAKHWRGEELCAAVASVCSHKPKK
jgi:hypothetical protein